MNFSDSSNYNRNNPNILQSYINKFGQFIVMILGMPCTNKSEIAKELVVDLKLPIININDYIIADKYIDKKIDGVKFKIYEHPDNYDWEKLNRDVNHLKSSGLILYGNYLDTEHINWKSDFNFFLSMNTNICKQKLIERNLLPYEKDDDKVSIYLLKIFNPLYDGLKEKIKFNKFFNIKEKTNFDEIYDELFDILMTMISQKNKLSKSSKSSKLSNSSKTFNTSKLPVNIKKNNQEKYIQEKEEFIDNIDNIDNIDDNKIENSDTIKESDLDGQSENIPNADQEIDEDLDESTESFESD